MIGKANGGARPNKTRRAAYQKAEGGCAMEQMERVLAALFDFQRFAGNPRLAGLVQETGKRTGGP